MAVNMIKTVTLDIPRDAAILIAKRRVRLMRAADSALRAGNVTEAHRIDVQAARAEVTLIRAGYPEFV